MAKTAAERKREQRTRQKREDTLRRVDAMTTYATVRKIASYADYHGMTVGETLTRAMTALWQSLPNDEIDAIWKQAEIREREERARKLRADLTLQLPFD